jgi:hypothetical protein
MYCWQLVLGLVFSLFLASGLFARPVELWSEDRLWKEADLVLIGTVKSSADAEADHSNAKVDSKIDVHTVFTVGRVLQGKRTTQTVVVRHLRYFGKETETEVVDGPLHRRIQFREEASVLDVPQEGRG